jgi:outer membrane lipoprotein LolB
MRRVALLLISCAALTACVTPRPVPAPTPAPWAERVAQLQRATAWQLDGRVAAAVGSQGWQAGLNWRQRDAVTEVHLAGPLGVGATVLKKTADGLSVNGAPPSGAELQQLQQRLGFELPLDELRFWLLGVPDPGAPFELTPGTGDRAQQVNQAGWTVTYDRYLPANGDLLPTRIVLTRDAVRVRIAVDHWEAPR